MGKRELLIALAFIVIGAAVYQVAAPPSKDGEGFSFAEFWNRARNGMMGRPRASATLAGTITVSPALRELRIVDINQSLKVVGEPREDIAYELSVRAEGADEAAALANAKRATLTQDDLGESLVLRVKPADKSRTTSGVVLRVPARLRVRIESVTASAGVNVSDVAGLQIDNATGTTVISRISGSLLGGHRYGDLTVSEIGGTVKMNLQRSEASFTAIDQGLTLDMPLGGTCVIAGSKGPLEVDEQRVTVRVSNHEGKIRIGGSGGKIAIDQPRGEVKVDVRRAPVTISAGLAVPMTVLTTEEELRLVLDASVKVTLDAQTAPGMITATDFGLTPQMTDADQRLTSAMGGASAPRITLRNQRGGIVIAKKS